MQKIFLYLDTQVIKVSNLRRVWISYDEDYKFWRLMYSDDTYIKNCICVSLDKDTLKSLKNKLLKAYEKGKYYVVLNQKVIY